MLGAGSGPGLSQPSRGLRSSIVSLPALYVASLYESIQFYESVQSRIDEYTRVSADREATERPLSRGRVTKRLSGEMVEDCLLIQADHSLLRHSGSGYLSCGIFWCSRAGRCRCTCRSSARNAAAGASPPSLSHGCGIHHAQLSGHEHAILQPASSSYRIAYFDVGEGNTLSPTTASHS